MIMIRLLYTLSSIRACVYDSCRARRNHIHFTLQYARAHKNTEIGAHWKLTVGSYFVVGIYTGPFSARLLGRRQMAKRGAADDVQHELASESSAALRSMLEGRKHPRKAQAAATPAVGARATPGAAGALAAPGTAATSSAAGSTSASSGCNAQPRAAARPRDQPTHSTLSAAHQQATPAERRTGASSQAGARNRASSPLPSASPRCELGAQLLGAQLTTETAAHVSTEAEAAQGEF